MYYWFLWLFSSLPFSLFLKDYVFKGISHYYSCSEVSERNTSTCLCSINHFSPQKSRLNQKPFLIVYTTRYHSHPILQSPEWLTEVSISSEQVESGPSGHSLSYPAAIPGLPFTNILGIFSVFFLSFSILPFCCLTDRLA